MDLLHQLPCVVYSRSALPLRSSSSLYRASYLVLQIPAVSVWEYSRGNSRLKSVSSRLCCTSFWLDCRRSLARTASSNVSDFTVYSLVLAPKQRVLVYAKDWCGGFSWDLLGRNSHSSWRNALSALGVLTTRSLRKYYRDGSGSPVPESKLEESSLRQAFAKREGRNLNGSRSKGSQAESPPSATAATVSGEIKSRKRVLRLGWKVEGCRDGRLSSSSKPGLAGRGRVQSNAICHYFSSFAETAVGSTHMKSQQRQNPDKQGAAERKQNQQMERKPKTRILPVETLLRLDLNNCSKDGDVLRALDIYDRSVTEGVVKWNQYHFNILLYLCSSAALGTLTARKSGTDRPLAERLNLQNVHGEGQLECTNGATVEQKNPSSNGAPSHENGAEKNIVVLSPEVMEMAAKRGFEIYEQMKAQEVQPNEATLTAVARLAVKTDDGDLAFKMVKEMAALNLGPKLRSYSPALVIFCKARAVEKAFEVDAHMLAAGVQPEETELAALLRLCVDMGLESKVYSLLHRLRGRVRELSPATVAIIVDWFSGEAGASAGRKEKQTHNAAIRQAIVGSGGGWHGLGWLGEGEWKLTWTKIDLEGVCCSCKEQLVTIDLDPEETEKFAQSLSELATSRETKANDFRKFQEWLGRHGPFDAIVDGANVGLYNQNFAQGGFNFLQLNSIVKNAQEQGLSKRPPLVVLHNARARFGAANSSLGQQLLQAWDSENTLYTTPSGSNDDWYWLYAAVKSKGFLITNDEMRDHLFQLLGTDFFPKWKERHQVRFSATTGGLQLHLPPPYSLVIQESEKGSWHIPQSGGDDISKPREWLCVTRPSLSLDSKAQLKLGGLADNGETLAQTSNVIGNSPENGHVVIDSAEFCSLESNGCSRISGPPKRSREPSPSETFRKIRAADKRSQSRPVTFDI